MIAKVCDRESRRDSWFENALLSIRPINGSRKKRQCLCNYFAVILVQIKDKMQIVSEHFYLFARASTKSDTMHFR